MVFKRNRIKVILEEEMKPAQFDLIIASVKSVCSFDQSKKNKCNRYSFIGIEAVPFLKKMCCHIDWKGSQTKGQCPSDRSTKSGEAHCF